MGELKLVRCVLITSWLACSAFAHCTFTGTPAGPECTSNINNIIIIQKGTVDIIRRHITIIIGLYNIIPGKMYKFYQGINFCSVCGKCQFMKFSIHENMCKCINGIDSHSNRVC